jgi:2-iminobutanoate/2-iminopropanoate deaminase
MPLTPGRSSNMSNKSIVQPPNLFRPAAPYSLGAVSNGFVFTAGMVALDQSGRPIGHTAGEQTSNILSAIADILQQAGTSMASIVKTTIYLADESHFSGMNEVYQTFFATEPPPRSTVIVKLLKPEWLVEIEAIAAK